jgi:hypothetical protein
MTQFFGTKAYLPCNQAGINFSKGNTMNIMIFLSHQAAPYLHAFTHALASMGLGMEGAVAYGDDAFFNDT